MSPFRSADFVISSPFLMKFGGSLAAVLYLFLFFGCKSWNPDAITGAERSSGETEKIGEELSQTDEESGKESEEESNALSRRHSAGQLVKLPVVNYVARWVAGVF